MDTHLLYEKMSKGEGVIVGVEVNRTNMLLIEDLDFVDVGQIITVYKNGQPVKKLPILAKAAINGDDLEIGYTCNGPIEVGGDGLLLYLSENIYRQQYQLNSRNNAGCCQKQLICHTVCTEKLETYSAFKRI